jgi:hypothetical protein
MISAVFSPDSLDLPAEDQFQIKLSDLQALIDRSSISDSPSVQQYCRDHATFRLKHIVKRINAGMREIRALWPDVTPIEIYVAFEMCGESIEDLIESIEAPGFRDRVRSSATSATVPDEGERQERESDGEEERESDDEEFVYAGTMEWSRKGVPPDSSRPDDVPEAEWALWSNAKKMSCIQAAAFPNAYYYRHLPPGEVRRNGGWTEEEKALFLKRMKEMRGNADTFGHDWGVFSMAIPGRVGYQCSSFYRKLITEGELKDSRYILDSQGKLHHTSRVRDGKISTYRKGVIKVKKRAPPVVTAGPLEVKDIRRLTLIRGSEPRGQGTKEEMLGRYEMWATQNPIPGAVDMITGEVMRVPALSPDGYVLDYKTWLGSLAEKPVNPFTQLPLRKRQLVVLTTENYQTYAGDIVNLGTNE